MKRLISLFLCMCMLITAASPIYAASGNSVEQTITALGIIVGDENGNLNLSGSVTRAEFAKMLISASIYKDSIQGSANSSSFKDVKYTHWASGYIKGTVSNQWMVGYVDGTFRPDNTITFEEAASAILKVLGYDASDLSGTYPEAQISKFKALKLDSGVSLYQGKILTRSDCMYIFYNLMGATNKSGAIYGTMLGYTINAAGKIDYLDVVMSDIEGPYVLDNVTISGVLPFDINQATIYRNGVLTDSGAISQYDVVYYNTNVKTVWSYSNKVIGTYTVASPNAVAPDSVTVAGNNYDVGTSAAKHKLSTTGEFAIGDTIVLLLGMNGDVVDVFSASVIDGKYYGVVTESKLSTYDVDASTSKANYIISVACTDGVTRECAVSGDYYTVGRVVTIEYTKGEAVVKTSGSSGITGTVSEDGKRIGDYALAANVEMMDVSEEGAWKIIYPTRLSGVTLPSGAVCCYALNSNQEITHIIFDDITGDMYSYGVVTRISESESDSSAGSLVSINRSYQYIIEGVSGTLNTTNTSYNVNVGPAIFHYKNGQISSMRKLSGTSISELSSIAASSGDKKYAVSENVQVYLKSGSNSYNQTKLSAVNTKEYKVTGYYEEIYTAGGQIRVIIAEKK